MPSLGVNIDHIATLRQQRLIGVPDLVSCAKTALKSGADSITVHLREDRRHIQDRDVFDIRSIKGAYLNLEMAASGEIMDIALKVKPDSVCFVPEKRRELTTEGGLDAAGNEVYLAKCVCRLKEKGILVSIFIDPDKRQIAASSMIGADAVEIHTGRYADSKKAVSRKRELEKIKKASRIVLDHGLRLHAGHGLDLSNVKPVAGIKGMRELNIGFSIIARALEVGLGQAVREMKRLV